MQNKKFCQPAKWPVTVKLIPLGPTGAKQLSKNNRRPAQLARVSICIFPCFFVFFVKLTHYFISLCVIKFLLTRHNFTTAFHINYSCCLCKYHYTFRPNAIWLYIAEVKRWILVANLSVIIHPSYSTWNAVHLSVRFHSERWMTSPR